jgi:hypothetical protein
MEGTNIIKSTISDLCREIIIKHEDKEEVIDAFNLIIKLLNNIKKDPKENKFRNFKISNEAIKSKVLIVSGILDLIQLIGYEKANEETYSYLGDNLQNLDMAIEALESAVVSIYRGTYLKPIMSSSGNTVTLLLYDLSQGMARSYSPILLGKVIEGIWHTSVLVHGVEFYYGGGIHEAAPRKSPYGYPVKEIHLGETEMSVDMLRDYLKDLKVKFNHQSYHILNNNCNHCANEIAFFLTGNNIPEHILNQHKELVNTPIGNMIMPMLEKMNQDNSQFLPDMFEGRR